MLNRFAFQSRSCSTHGVLECCNVIMLKLVTKLYVEGALDCSLQLQLNVDVLSDRIPNGDVFKVRL